MVIHEVEAPGVGSTAVGSTLVAGELEPPMGEVLELTPTAVDVSTTH